MGDTAPRGALASAGGAPGIAGAAGVLGLHRDDAQRLEATNARAGRPQDCCRQLGERARAPVGASPEGKPDCRRPRKPRASFLPQPKASAKTGRAAAAEAPARRERDGGLVRGCYFSRPLPVKEFGKLMEEAVRSRFSSYSGIGARGLQGGAPFG